MKALRVLKVLLIVLVAATVLSYVVMRLWNWLVPEIFGLHSISWLQALGLLLLSKILLGGFHRHGGGPGAWKRQAWKRKEWKRRMEARWANMTPEERERFRAGMKARHSCRFGGADRMPEESAS